MDVSTRFSVKPLKLIFFFLFETGVDFIETMSIVIDRTKKSNAPFSCKRDLGTL